MSLAASLLLVIGAIVAFGWIFSRSKMIGGGNSDAIRIVASRALGAKERLMLVEIADKQLLIGMTPAHVQTLHVFDSPVVSSGSGSGAGATGYPAGFRGRLRNALQEMRG